CPNSSTGVAIGSGAVAGDTYSWTSYPPGFTSSSSNPVVSPAITTTYTLTETISKTGCKNSNSTLVAVYPVPAVNAGKSRPVCEGDSIVLGASAVAGYKYSWSSKPFGFSASKANPS